jgi:hypothetical protein
VVVSHFIPFGASPWYLLDRMLVVPSVGLDAMQKKEVSVPARIRTDSPVVQSVALLLGTSGGLL